MATLTKAEAKWIKDMQALIDKCPSKRIGFYTIGDSDISAFDVTKNDEITEYQDRHRCAEFCHAVSALDAGFDARLVFTNPVFSTAG